MVLILHSTCFVNYTLKTRRIDYFDECLIGLVAKDIYIHWEGMFMKCFTLLNDNNEFINLLFKRLESVNYRIDGNILYKNALQYNDIFFVEQLIKYGKEVLS